MHRREIISGIAGAVLAVLAALLVSHFFVVAPIYWLSAVFAAIFGLIGGALGHHFIEGLLAVAVYFGVLLLILLLVDNSAIREIAIGFACGSGIGWFVHGVYSLGPPHVT